MTAAARRLRAFAVAGLAATALSACAVLGGGPDVRLEAESDVREFAGYCEAASAWRDAAGAYQRSAPGEDEATSMAELSAVSLGLLEVAPEALLDDWRLLLDGAQGKVDAGSVEVQSAVARIDAATLIDCGFSPTDT